MANGLGTAILDFGATPATEATVEVTEQTDITADARVEAWVMARSTADNGTIDHQYAATSLRLSTSEPVPGVGFSITAYNLFGYLSIDDGVTWQAVTLTERSVYGDSISNLGGSYVRVLTGRVDLVSPADQTCRLKVVGAGSPVRQVNIHGWALHLLP